MVAAKPIEPGRNVYQRISEMKILVSEATFTKVKGEGLKFAYLPVDQMKPIVESAMNKVGLYLLRGPIEWENMRDPWDSSNGYSTSKWFHLCGRRTFAWVNVDNPSDRSEPQTYDGEAKDNSDKTLNKLSTAILKSFYKEEFNISESPKDDTDNTEDELKAEKEAQKKAAEQRAKNDPLFGSSKKETHKDITGDRPVEVMADTIGKTARRDFTVREKLGPVAKKYGVNPQSILKIEAEAQNIPADCIKEMYVLVCDLMKTKEGA